MGVVIRVTGTDGAVGQCDRKCYAAVDGRCVCVCGGLNHGVGETEALANLHKIIRFYTGKADVEAIWFDPRGNQIVFSFVDEAE